jgi:hypothetical protein
MIELGAIIGYGLGHTPSISHSLQEQGNYNASSIYIVGQRRSPPVELGIDADLSRSELLTDDERSERRAIDERTSLEDLEGNYLTYEEWKSARGSDRRHHWDWPPSRPHRPC